MDTIAGMKTFAAVAAHASFTEGARQVGISTKLASKYIGQLEERLNAQLFNRTTRSVTLTDTGRSYYDRCLPLLEQFDELEGLVQQRQSELAGRIRITAPTGYGSSQLVHLLKPFQTANPKVSIELHLSDAHVSLIEEGHDLAVRFGALKDSSLVARKLMDMRIVCCAAPEYLETHGHPNEPAALTTHNCLLQTTSSHIDQWEFQGPQKIYNVAVSGNFRANSPRAVANMAADGLGIGRVPLYTAQPFLDAGRLQLLFEAEEAKVLGLYAVYPPSRHLTARIRAVIDHLAAQF
ncbi:HTH-type transcriptional regulator DmlR [Ascidiaceihabitans donghaensis]|uniref:HTH-type transcriptional regulator DmlR n=1 Tax=Ascidiaceihabitans donghaensis TaxID=1510460 RepID=A0A2R8BBD0_9RHOB|nr:LysR family transcriptional regulator [Ascidiaceihabitans donghaensis]SPH20375.1 HTH-type transcriptional regulator DmlR [Ascidiaceihabitans donghaensis]